MLSQGLVVATFSGVDVVMHPLCAAQVRQGDSVAVDVGVGC